MPKKPHPIAVAVVLSGLKWGEVEARTGISHYRLWALRQGRGPAPTAVERRKLARVLKVAPEALGL